MRRKDREVTDFDEIVKIIDECEVLRLGLVDGDYPYIMARRADTAKFDWNRAALGRVAIAKLIVTEITAKANPFKGGATSSVKERA